MSGSKTKTKSYTGITKDRFADLIGSGSAQAGSGNNANFGELGAQHTTKVKVGGKIRFKPDFDFEAVSQKDLDELVFNFNQRQASLIRGTQIQGRNQLLLTDNN